MAWNWLCSPWKSLRFWFYDTFATRAYERIYRGHGDFTERRGWLYRGQFIPLDDDELEAAKAAERGE